MNNHLDDSLQTEKWTPIDYDVFDGHGRTIVSGIGSIQAKIVSRAHNASIDRILAPPSATTKEQWCDDCQAVHEGDHTPDVSGKPEPLATNTHEGQSADGEKCEGCGDPATTFDTEGVPLCARCAALP